MGTRVTRCVRRCGWSWKKFGEGEVEAEVESAEEEEAEVEVRDRVLRVCFEILRVEVRGWEADIGRGDAVVGVLVVVGGCDGGCGCGVVVGELLVLLGVMRREVEGLRRGKPIVVCGENWRA